MTRRSPRLEWLPPLMVGASAAVVAEVAMALLLYGGAGFVRSLTTILAVEGIALAGGLWSAPTPGADLVDRLRRRWLLCLFSFVAAALFGMAWSVFPEVSEARWGQGVGLALLGGLPLYAAGSVLGGMSALAGSDAGGRLSIPGPAAAAGAAMGFVLTGFLLPRVPLPASLLLACLVMLSLGGMIYGGVLGSRTEIRPLSRRPGRGPEVRVEERTVPADGVAALELMEGPFLRRSVPLEDSVDAWWDVALVSSVLPEDPDGFRALLVGGGASDVRRRVLQAHPRASVDVLERTAAVVELGREHFATDLRVGPDDRGRVSVGNLDDALLASDGGYDLVLIDSDALAPIGGLAGLSRMSRRRLPALVRSGGILACGPDGSEMDVAGIPPEWSPRRYRRPARDRDDVEVETVVMARRPDGRAWRPVVAGFKEISVS